jgi:hypothetical protein|uniref:Tail assembly chaperone protein n=1 Tax=Siphoviridae sp. ctnNB1 TaxID=2825660 RepID=A0A8S5UV83_9CAUD|nr:MAG TPA: tail assembly chaperone protein [Siphoviridae sp. ctnNB1]
MLEFEGVRYTLRFSQKRIEMIEAVTNMPTMAELSRTKGFLSLSALKTYFAYALKYQDEESGGGYVNVKKGMDICTKLIDGEGYEAVCMLVLEALERGCPFFFPRD